MTAKDPLLPELYAGDRALGLVRGQAGARWSIEAISRALSDDPPRRGDFLLLERGDDEALVARVVSARAGGTFAEGREAGASYLVELLHADRGGVPDAVRELLHRLHLELQVLGALRRTKSGFEFESGHRELDPFGLKLRLPSGAAQRFLASAGQQAGPGVVQFGVLARGHETQDDVPVLFSIDRLKGKRSFVFARAGYGKSNLVKLLISKLYEAPPDVGLLILDPEGEYAFEQGVGDRKVPGLADHPEIRRRLKVFTGRKDKHLKERYADVIAGDLRLDLGECEPGEVLTSFIAAEKTEQVWANWIKGLSRRGEDEELNISKRWPDLIALLHEKQYEVQDDEMAGCIFSRHRPPNPKEGGGNVSLQAVRNNLVPLVRRVHDSSRKTLSTIVDHLKHGNVVILDLSLASHQDARSLANLVLFRLFRDQQRRFTESGPPRGGVLAVFEEAQTVLSPRESDTSIFVRWVKEGRKYGLGSLMITQQPGSIAESLVAQGDNFFVMHLLGQTDLELLQRHNAHYSEDVLEFIRNEPVKGNCYFWSAPDQPYVVPCRVANYDDLARTEAASNPAPKRLPAAIEAEPAPDVVVSSIDRTVLQILATSDRVYLVPVATIDGQRVDDFIAVSKRYLHQEFNAWLHEDGRARIATAAIDLHVPLERLGLLARPKPCRGSFAGSEHEWLVLDRAKLADLCHRSELPLKPASSTQVELRAP